VLAAAAAAGAIDGARAGGDKISDFELKLMDIDSESLTIPETDYKAIVTLPSTEFQRICRDLTVLGETGTLRLSLSLSRIRSALARASHERHTFAIRCLCTVTISVNKEGVKFSVAGDIGTGNIHCRPSTAVDKVCIKRRSLTRLRTRSLTGWLAGWLARTAARRDGAH